MNNLALAGRFQRILDRGGEVIIRVPKTGTAWPPDDILQRKDVECVVAALRCVQMEDV
jgi:hypothetical protein